jgi:hypothetical protein
MIVRKPDSRKIGGLGEGRTLTPRRARPSRDRASACFRHESRAGTNGIEPSTAALTTQCSTSVLRPHQRCQWTPRESTPELPGGLEPPTYGFAARRLAARPHDHSRARRTRIVALRSENPASSPLDRCPMSNSLGLSEPGWSLGYKPHDTVEGRAGGALSWRQGQAQAGCGDGSHPDGVVVDRPRCLRASPRGIPQRL